MEEIRQLVFKEILGTITEAERAILFLEVERDDRVREMRELMLMNLNNDEVKEYIESNEPLEFAYRVTSKIHKRGIWKRVAVAAVMAGLIGGVIWLYHGKEKAPLAAGGVQLVLPGGARVEVEKGAVNVGGVRFSNHNKRGHYEAVGLVDQYAVLNVPAGKDYTIILSDGTVVQLNAASTLRFPLNFGRQCREVFIEGEAYVEVAKEAKRPFTVHLPGTNVVVLGTAFNVNTYSCHATKVALVEGAVKVVSRQDSMLLKPGEQAVADGKIKVNHYDAYETLSWREGKFVLNNARMEEVCRVGERMWGMKIEMDHLAIGEKRFSGVIDRNQSVEELMKALKATNGVDYYWKNNVIHIK